ncbi:hypothetical protein EXIGLDRAFT_692692 [Exidia glandulosa HHB12029]|uniref:Uncharacterized protein n=1 Tax=Exidia glandulosa HHB12029 TaxID=1314781 RepID=A0A165HTZ8_EXIGL|nr:hypothetical protein EXIGLDRAFT_692692 [Exidia glandulosa HHB12029]
MAPRAPVALSPRLTAQQRYEVFALHEHVWDLLSLLYEATPSGERPLALSSLLELGVRCAPRLPGSLDSEFGVRRRELYEALKAYNVVCGDDDSGDDDLHEARETLDQQVLSFVRRFVEVCPPEVPLSRDEKELFENEGTEDLMEVCWVPGVRESSDISSFRARHLEYLHAAGREAGVVCRFRCCSEGRSSSYNPMDWYSARGSSDAEDVGVPSHRSDTMGASGDAMEVDIALGGASVSRASSESSLTEPSSGGDVLSGSQSPSPPTEPQVSSAVAATGTAKFTTVEKTALTKVCLSSRIALDR